MSDSDFALHHGLFWTCFPLKIFILSLHDEFEAPWFAIFGETWVADNLYIRSVVTVERSVCKLI